MISSEVCFRFIDLWSLYVKAKLTKCLISSQLYSLKTKCISWKMKVLLNIPK